MTERKPPLKLIALDDEDLQVISACCQDAVLSVGSLDYIASEKRFLLTLNRFVWEDNPKNKNYERRRAVLHFERVSRVQLMGIDRREKDMVLSLMAVRFTAGEDPSGTIELIFAGDGAVKLDVECIEAQLADMDAAWETKSRPDHEIEN